MIRMTAAEALLRGKTVDLGAARLRPGKVGRRYICNKGIFDIIGLLVIARD